MRSAAPALRVGGAFGAGARGVAMPAAAHCRGDRRQQGGERAHGGGFAGAAIAQRQHAAQAGVGRGQQQRGAQLVLANNGGEREGRRRRDVRHGRAQALRLRRTMVRFRNAANATQAR